MSKNIVFNDISFTAILQGITPSDSVKVRHSPLAREKFDEYSAITWKWCKIGGKLVLITNRKSFMSCGLIPKSVTLNDLKIGLTAA